MNELPGLCAGAAGAVGFVEAFIRIDTANRLVRVAGVCRKASSVLMSSRISDHWKERAIPAYSLAIFRATGIVALQIAMALAVFAVIAFIVAKIAGAPIDSTMLLDWPFNIGALVGGSIYAYGRGRVTG